MALSAVGSTNTLSAITLYIQIKTPIYIYIIESLVHVTYVIVRHYILHNRSHYTKFWGVVSHFAFINESVQGLSLLILSLLSLAYDQSTYAIVSLNMQMVVNLLFLLPVSLTLR